ncbi:MAG: hypothetical protein ACI85O_002347, partial [Saprospiraceae bacterium]
FIRVKFESKIFSYIFDKFIQVVDTIMKISKSEYFFKI